MPLCEEVAFLALCVQLSKGRPRAATRWWFLPTSCYDEGIQPDPLYTCGWYFPYRRPAKPSKGRLSAKSRSFRPTSCYDEGNQPDLFYACGWYFPYQWPAKPSKGRLSAKSRSFCLPSSCYDAEGFQPDPLYACGWYFPYWRPAKPSKGHLSTENQSFCPTAATLTLTPNLLELLWWGNSTAPSICCFANNILDD